MDAILAWLLWLLLSITSLFLLSQANKRRSTSFRHLPPGPRPLPIIGNLLLLGSQPHRSLSTLSKTYGPIMTLRLGAVNTIVVSSPEAAKEVLKKHDAALSHCSVPDSLRILSREKSSVVWLDPSQRWRNLRRLCSTQLFASHRLDALKDLRVQKVREIGNHIAELSSSGAPVDIGRLAFIAALNFLSRTIFSTDLVGFGDESREFKDIIEGIMVVAGCPNVSDVFPAIAWLDLQGIRRRSIELLEKLHRIFDEQIERRLQQGESSASEDLLDILLECQRGDPENFDRTAMFSLLSVRT